jgi:serralysin
MATTNKAFLVGNTVGNNIIRFDLTSDGLLWEEFISADTGLLSDPDTLLYGPDANGDGLKDLYVTNGADLGTSSILRFDGGSGEFIDRFVGDDPTTEFNETGGLIRPYELAFGPAGNLYVASFLSDQILRYDGQTGEFIDVFAEGNGEPGGLNGPNGLLFVNGALYVTTQGSVATEDPDTGEVIPSFAAGLPSQILRYDSLEAGSDPTVFAAPDPSPDSFGFVSLLGMEVGPNDGDLYVSDFAGDLLRFDLESGELLDRLATNFTTDTAPSNNFIGNLAFADNGDLLAVGFDVSSTDGAVLSFATDTNGSPTAPFDLLVPQTAELKRPIGITFFDHTPAPIVVDFEGDGLVAGTVVTDQFEGISVTTDTEFGAMLFDTLNPTGGDSDLASDSLGHVLIISEDGDSADPDDNARGGTLSFAFDDLVGGLSVGLLDIDEVGSSITLFDESDMVIETFDIPNLGDNSLQTLSLGEIGSVARMEVFLNGSGAITNLIFSPTDFATAA